MAVDFLGKSLVGVDMCSWDDEEHGWDEHEGATVTNAEADAHAAAPMAAAAAVATGDFMFHSGLLWVEMSYPSAMRSSCVMPVVVVPRCDVCDAWLSEALSQSPDS